MKILYVEDTHSDSEEEKVSKTVPRASLANGNRRFAFGTGTLHGHLLVSAEHRSLRMASYLIVSVVTYTTVCVVNQAGEERFAVEWIAENDKVSYDIYSFSKPAHPLAALAYPVVRYKQALFAKKSSEAMLKAVADP